jgi:hypothetical protein
LNNKKPFLETTWSKVEAGDTVLVAHADEIVQVTVKEARASKADDGEELVFIYYGFRYAKYGVTCDPGDTAYVQSRL